MCLYYLKPYNFVMVIHKAAVLLKYPRSSPHASVLFLLPLSHKLLFCPAIILSVYSQALLVLPAQQEPSEPMALLVDP